MAKKFKWGTEKQCGFIGCNKQIIWGDFLFGAFACENHWNRKWELCEACQTEKTTHTIFYNIHSNRKSKEESEQVKEGIEFQKEIIEKLLAKNISESLRQKLNEAYQKVQEVEKIIPELERLTSEYWEKKVNCAGNFVREKGGQQTNIYRCNLCDKCGDEVSNRQQKLENDYQLKVLNKLIVFDSETSTQIEKEIGRDKAVKIAFELTLYSEKVTENQQSWIRQNFIKKIPFFEHERSTKWHKDKRTLLQKLKQYFQDHSIMQIFIQPNGDYVVWYTNGNVEEKKSSQLTAEVTWRRDGEKALSLYEINKELKSLEQELSNPSEQEEPNRDKENDKKGKINSLSDLELELVKLFFRNHKVKKIVLKNGELVITHNNNNEIITAEQLTTNSEYQMIKNSLEKIDKNELVSQDLGINSDNTSTGSNNPKPSNYQLIIGLTLGAGTVILVGIIFYFIRKRKKR